MTSSQFAQSSSGYGRHRARVPGGALASLGILAAALSAAFVLAPGVLAAIWPGGGYAGQGALIAAVRTGFVEYWSSGDQNYPPELDRLVDYWLRYHVAKAVTAALLLTVLIMLCARLWGPLLRAGRLAPGREAALALSGALAAVLALCAAVLTVVNIQGAVAPFALRARTGSSERRIRGVLGLAGVVSAVLSLAVIVVAVANLGNAMHPAPALLAFFNGGAGGL
jgi:hypothetical protein